MSDFVFTKDFPAGETFSAVYSAEQWLASIGCSYGSMQEDRHFNDVERASFDGQIEPIGDFRNGGARVKLRFQP